MGNDDFKLSMYYLAPPNVINVVFVCPLLNCNHFYSNHLEKLHTLLTSQLTLSDFRPFSVKTHSLKIKNLRTLKSSSSSTTSSSSAPELSMQETPAYEIRGRTMSLEEWDLNVQVENPVDFTSLAHHGCDIKKYYEAQDLLNYFDLLNGPTYMNLVRHF